MKVRGVSLHDLGRPLTRSKRVILSCYLNSHVVTLEQNCVCTETVELTYCSFQGYKNQLMHLDLSEGGEECNPGELTSVLVKQI